MSDKLKKTIVLVGLMGCGKSAIGKRLAEDMSVDFVDSDAKIEQYAGKTITEIFADDGEGEFRKIEEAVISEILDGKPCVLATGGGAYTHDNIRALIKQKAIAVWIYATFDILLERVSRKNTRPLLENGDKAAILKKLMDERYPIYEQADYRVETTTGPHEIVVKEILEQLQDEKNTA